MGRCKSKTVDIVATIHRNPQTYREIAHSCDCNEYTVSRVMGELRKAGLVRFKAFADYQITAYGTKILRRNGKLPSVWEWTK